MSTPGLDQAQQRAVDADADRLLILAGAGTGKTRTLTHRVARLVNAGVQPEGIVLVTFTNRAAREMVKRLRTLLGDRAERVRAGTFHALAFTTLRAHGQVLHLPPRFTILDRDGAMRLMAEAPVPDVSPRRLVDLLSVAVNADLPLTDAVRRHAPDLTHVTALIAGAADRFAHLKAERGLLDFDDLLVAWRLFLESDSPEARAEIARTEHVLVDEYQDTNRLQAEIAEALGGQLAVVGDDAQSIFGFRGADHENILAFAALDGTNVHRLETSYRATPELVRLANDVASRAVRRLNKTLVADRPSGAKPTWVSAPTEADEARFIVQRIVELEASGVPFGAQAILHRAHRHADRVAQELDARGVPYGLRSGTRYLERPEIKDVVATLRALVDPDDRSAWRRVLSRRDGIGQRTAEAVLANWPDHGTAADRLTHAAAVAPIAKHLGQRAAAVAGHFARIESAPDVRSKVEQIVGDAPSTVATPLLEAADTAKDIDTFLASLTLESGASDARADGVTVSTVHQAKGLEWSVVFVAHLVDGEFPIRSTLDDPAAFEEERRLFYVALTRARDRLYLTHPTSIGRIVAPVSRFLTAMDAALVDHWDVR